MSPKPPFAITLPRNLSFHSDLPHTPVPQLQTHDEELDVMEPPPPPKQTFKVRRRKADSVPRDIIADIEGDIEGHGLPIIEMTEAESRSSPESAGAFNMDLLPGYLAPRSTRLPILPPPKTPVAQMLDNQPPMHYDWSATARPLSSCSNSSNSSASSHGSSLDSLPDFDNCVSPDSDIDPFTYEAKPPVFSPELSSSEFPSNNNKRSKTTEEAKWTPEMDNHLWLTYLKCLQDPELTPFKMLPGTAPPLGICGRVARDAKHSWKGPRHFDIPSDDTIRPGHAQTWSHWPRNDAGTRKRLRKLCKRTPSLSAHYQRLMQARTPSPFQSSSSPDVVSDAQPPSFAGVRDEIPSTESVVTPLKSEIDDAPFGLLPHNPVRRARPDGWFSHVGRRSQAHQKSQSLQIALGRYDTAKELASPFNAGQTPNNNYTRSLGRNLNPGHIEPALKSPLELHAPIPTNRSLKRRFGILDESPANINRLEGLFQAPSSQGPAPARPARDRAFSVGTALDNDRALSFGADDMSGIETQMSDDIFAAAPSAVSHASSALLNQTQGRLGSPFTLPPPKPHFNTFPRQFTPLGTEMHQQNFRANFSLEGKFRELAAQSCSRQ